MEKHEHSESDSDEESIARAIAMKESIESDSK